MARLLLVRHGQSAWNAESRWQGWADPPLSDLGVTQATALASALAPTEFQGVVSSDLQRARRTASIAAQALELPVQVEPALRERDVGAWQGLTITEIERRWPDDLAAWRSGRLAAPPGGEPDQAMAARVTEALGRLLARPEDSLLVVTHGGVIRLVERGLGHEPSSTPNLYGRWVHGTGNDGFAYMVSGAVFTPDMPDMQDAGQPVFGMHRTTEHRSPGPH